MVRTDARGAMIDAAERIVAERGLAAMSLREVQSVAGQSNKSAAQYHFGSREGLVSAVVEARMAPIDGRRRELLDELNRTGAPGVRPLVEALVLPLASATLDRPASHYARFLAQATFDPTLAAIIEQHLRAESFREVRQRLIDACPLAAAVASLRTWNVVVLTLSTLAVWEGRTDSGPATTTIIGDLVDSCVALITAPTSLTIGREEHP